MKKNNLLFIFILHCILGYSQNEYFDPLEDLGYGYGSRNIEEIKDNKINFPSSSEEVHPTNISSKANNKKIDFQAYKNAYKNNIRAQLQTNQDNNEYAKVYSFETQGTNFDRFENSPCYDEIGFNPTWDITSLEKRYSDCEKDKNLKLALNALYIIAFALIIGAVFFYSRKKQS